MNYIRLPLEGTYNTRDLGGYPTNDNKITVWNKVLRSDNLDVLTGNDIDILLNDYKLSVVLDLRSEKEMIERPNVLQHDQRINFYQYPVFDDLDPSQFGKLASLGSELNLGDFYIISLKTKLDVFKNCLDLFLNLEDSKSIIFHCSAGKDRTGILAMLLLGICNVSRQDICANYSQSEDNLEYKESYINDINESKVQYLKLFDNEVVENLMGTKRIYMEKTYDFIISEYGSFECYFDKLGYNKDDINKFRVKYTK